MNTGMQQLRYGETVIEYHLIRRKRKTLAIKVNTDLQVTVIAPVDADYADVQTVVRRRAPWILRKQREFERYLPKLPPRQYVSGETHRYLGRQYRLKVIQDDQSCVKLTRGYLHVWTPDKANTRHVQRQVEGWYRRQAQRVFRDRLQALLPRFAHVEIPQPELKIRKMKSRWGSARKSGSITLNLKLMQVPKHYIDYVVVHEFCHLVEHNHSKRYYALLDRMMPDWRERRQRLNEYQVN